MSRAELLRRLRLPEFLLSLAAVGFAFLVAEIVGPRVATLFGDAPTVTFYEESWNTVHFDPVLGYRLSNEPSRFARFCAGRLEFVGVLKGNNQGFPDRDDFGFGRGDDRAPRLAIYGDSFTAGQFLEVNWPDRVEEISRRTGRPLTLLNLAVDGAGLGNWWSILHRWAVPGSLEADVAIFAVFDGDLERRFSVSEHRGYDRHMFGRVKSWDPATWPTTLTEAREVLEPLPGIVVDREVYADALLGRFPPEVVGLAPPPPRFGRFLVSRLRRLVPAAAPAGPGPDGPCGPTAWDPAQLTLVKEMDRDLDRLRERRIVVFLGDREDVVSGSRCQPVHERDFAARLHAEFVDGREMFEGLSPAERRALFFPVDGHWNQAGSDTFAHFLAERLARGAGAASPAPASAAGALRHEAPGARASRRGAIRVGA